MLVDHRRLYINNDADFIISNIQHHRTIIIDHPNIY